MHLMHADMWARRFAAELASGGGASSVIRSVMGGGDDLFSRAASFEMRGGLGPDFYAVGKVADDIAGAADEARTGAGSVMAHWPTPAGGFPPGHFLG